MMLLYWLISVMIVVGAVAVASGLAWYRQQRQFTAQQAYNSGLACLQANEPAKAIEAFRLALQRRKNWRDAHYGLGLAYLQEQRYQDSLAVLEELRAVMPHDAILQSNLSWAYLNVGRVDEAERLLLQALQLNPEIKEIHFNLGRVYQEKGNKDRALFHFRRALELDRNYLQAQHDLERLAEIRYDVPLPPELIRQALQNFEPDDTELMLTL